MTTKHTPGPWRIGEHLYIGAADRLIATVSLYGDGFDVPNAQLIAAAPDMLAALESSTLLLRRELAALTDSPYAFETIKAQISINDAVSRKAKGEP